MSSLAPTRPPALPAEAALPFSVHPVLPVRPHDLAAPQNAFTVDVEDWYQSCVDYDAPITERVVRNVDRILDVLDECGTKGTFFVQGKVAEAFPGMVADLVGLGHEVQSHGYSHRPLHAMNRTELRDELVKAKQTVEDAAGTRVTAFRAQDFSIRTSNLWAFDVLAEVGFEIDSSIFAMKSRHYGIANWHLGPHHLLLPGGERILEIPVALWSLRGLRVPVAGGGYFRLLPRRVIERGLRSIGAESRPAIVYCHPYEFNPTELSEYQGVSRRLRVSQGIGRGSFTGRMRELLPRFAFGRMDAVLAAWSLA